MSNPSMTLGPTDLTNTRDILTVSHGMAPLVFICKHKELVIEKPKKTPSVSEPTILAMVPARENRPDGDQAVVQQWVKVEKSDTKLDLCL